MWNWILFHTSCLHFRETDMVTGYYRKIGLEDISSLFTASQIEAQAEELVQIT